MALTRSILTIAFVAARAAGLGAAGLGAGGSRADLESILANPKIVKALDDIKADDERAFAEQKRITEIPAPPFKEKLRAEYYLKRMQELGFKDARSTARAMSSRCARAPAAAGPSSWCRRISTRCSLRAPTSR